MLLTQAVMIVRWRQSLATTLDASARPFRNQTLRTRRLLKGSG